MSARRIVLILSPLSSTLQRASWLLPIVDSGIDEAEEVESPLKSLHLFLSITIMPLLRLTILTGCVVQTLEMSFGDFSRIQIHPRRPGYDNDYDNVKLLL